MENDLVYSGNIATNSASESLTDFSKKTLVSKRSTSDFNNYLNRAYESKQSETDKRKPTTKSTSGDKQLGNKTERIDKKSQFVKKKTQNNPIEKAAADASETSKSEDIDNASDATSVNTDKLTDEKQVITELAELLEIPEDQVLQILNTLSLTVPDLKNNENLIKFMQEFYSVSDATELLSIPNIKDSFIQVNEILESYDGIVAEPSVMEKANIVSEPIDSNIAMISESNDNEVVLIQPTELVQDQAVPEIPAEQIEVITEQSVISEPNVLVQVANVSKEPVAELEGEVLLPEQLSEVDGLQTITTSVVAPTTESFSGSKESGYGNQGQENEPYDSQDINFNLFNNQGNININTNTNMLFRETQLRNLSTSNIKTQDVVDQIVNTMKVEIKANITEVKLTLKPESLGEVSLKISMENGIVTAQFTAENQKIKAIIESNFNQLKDTLQQQGINISELYVSVGQDKTQERMEEYNRSRQKSASRIRQIISAISNEEIQNDELSAISGLDERIVDVTA